MHSFLLPIMALAILASGCSRTPQGPAKPNFYPDFSASQALAEYDADQSGSIDETEVEKSPGLKVAFSRIDKDGDRKLSQEEISERVEGYRLSRINLMSRMVRVAVAGRALEGAIITFEPEAFMGDHFEACSGSPTLSDGSTYLKGFDPISAGIYLGMYKVRISKKVDGKEIIPAKYNTETILGFEAADDLPAMFNGIVFNLKRK